MSNWLNYVNLSDDYERRARFLPALLTLLALLPLSGDLWTLFSGWIEKLIAGAGIAAVLAVGLSHLASAFGNRFQRQLWPRWPHDSPTNRWLHPEDNARSAQQKAAWYSAIRQLTGLDIAAAASDGPQELDAVINDAVTQLRNLLWKSDHATRVTMHNIEYGFARNLTGLRPIWLTVAVLSAAMSWYEYFFGAVNTNPPLFATVYVIVMMILAFAVLPKYTRQRATHYAESFFSAVLKLTR